MPPRKHAQKHQKTANNNNSNNSDKNTSEPSSQPSSSASGRSDDVNKLNPKTDRYRLYGTPGVLGLSLGLPLLVLLFAFGCDDLGYTPFERLHAFLSDLLARRFDWELLLSLPLSWDYMSVLWYFTFLAQLVTFSVAMPGEVVEGTPLRDGTRLQYKFNAFPAIQTMITMGFMSTRGQGLRLPLWVHANLAHLAAASIVVSFIIALVAYAFSFIGKQRLLSLEGNTGNPVYDFIVGRELNPRLGQFDIKFFTALRPGFVGWLFLDFCMAAKQWVELGRLTNSMILLLIFQTWYIVDALWNEARYLADRPQDLNFVQLTIAAMSQVVGYYIYFSARNQKKTMKENPEDPSVRGLTYLETKHGRLITSGWWASARHIEYLGQWLMSLAWCLACGFDSAIPYLYTLSTGIVLIYRECLDEEEEKDLYGADWDIYSKQVEYRIVPGVY
ncbi:erg24, C-14 sterol reductase [Apophysomyces ossiformis]|uniref:Erg24, C-14 sterol reductase n=1 Tax=Apophysomyces ossiformis TaxID=679940 RepID=A0A8H7BNU5_9FUNG|nr:erg24, C-14 sterol reductase [Apophysomyces ossiformis]